MKRGPWLHSGPWRWSVFSNVSLFLDWVYLFLQFLLSRRLIHMVPCHSSVNSNIAVFAFIDLDDVVCFVISASTLSAVNVA